MVFENKNNPFPFRSSEDAQLLAGLPLASFSASLTRTQLAGQQLEDGERSGARAHTDTLIQSADQQGWPLISLSAVSMFSLSLSPHAVCHTFTS